MQSELPPVSLSSRARPKGTGNFVFSLIVSTLALAACLNGLKEAVAAKPNIIVMMADDMGMGDSSAYQDITGNLDEDQIHTPHMERLARSGIRFTDAHSSSSRCTNTRYGLLTGRYAWRNRMKWWVLFGAQGDPMIEPDRPTIASMLQGAGYRTGMVGKWHVGLRYRTKDGAPAAGFEDADLSRPLWDSPLDHGFDYCRFTSRSHGTSGPQPDRLNKAQKPRRRNRPNQMVGPGHVHGRDVVGATDEGRKLVEKGKHAYVLKELGGRHSDHAIEFLQEHVVGKTSQKQPFFLYYACNSNHTPYTPDSQIDGKPVAGAGRNVAGDPVDRRGDFVYENDVALGRLLDFLNRHDDPRNPGNKLAENTIVVFTSDNGAEIRDKTATGPFRSNKGSAFEGGHRVPFLVAWPAGNVGDGDEASPGETNDSLIGLHDLYATFAEVVEQPLPELASGKKGAEDSRSALDAWRSGNGSAALLFHNDHKEAEDPAVCALRCNNPVIDGSVFEGQWKVFFTADLIRSGLANPTALYELSRDSDESQNLLDDPAYDELIKHLTKLATLHRRSGGHRWAQDVASQRICFDWRSDAENPRQDVIRFKLAEKFSAVPIDGELRFTTPEEQLSQVEIQPLTLTVLGTSGQSDSSKSHNPNNFTTGENGLGISGGQSTRLDSGEALEISFNQDVVVESVALVAGDGQCGGFYRVGKKEPLAVYCVDADNDSRDQSGILSDIGLLLRGDNLRLDSKPQFGTEPPGSWRVQSITVRTLK